MKKYDRFMEELKKPGKADFDRLYSSVLLKRRKQAQQNRLALSLAGIFLAFVSGFYSFQVYSWSNGEGLTSYLYERPAYSDSPVLDYVFSE
jgi:hypothetical protein